MNDINWINIGKIKTRAFFPFSNDEQKISEFRYLSLQRLVPVKRSSFMGVGDNCSTAEQILFAHRIICGLLIFLCALRLTWKNKYTCTDSTLRFCQIYKEVLHEWHPQKLDISTHSSHPLFHLPSFKKFSFCIRL